MSRSKLFFDIFGDDKSAPAFESVNNRLTQVTDKMKNVGKNMQLLGAGLTVGVTAPLTLAAKNMVDLFNQQDRAMALVRTGVESTEGAAGRTAEELFSMASALQDITAVGDEDILQNVTSQLLTFTDVTGEAFDRAQLAVLDLTTTTGSLSSNAIRIGKALNDPVSGLGSLRDAGIQFTDEQEQVIKSMVEMGDTAGAQTMILDELATQFGGRAAAAAETFGGQVDGLRGAWGDLQEQFGAIIVDFLPPLVDLMENVVDWLAKLDPDTKKWAVVVGGLAAALGPVVAALGLFVAGIAAIGAPVLIVVGAITGLSLAFFAFRDDLIAAKDSVVDFANAALERIKALPDEIIGALSALPGRMVEMGQEIMAGLWQGLKGRMDGIKAGITDFGSGMIQGFKDKLGIESPSKVFMEFGRNIMEGLGLGLEQVAPQVGSKLEAVTDDLQSSIKGMFRSVLVEGRNFKSALSSVLGGFADSLLNSAFDNLFPAIFPGFANGTQFAPGGLALVGERGPELVNLPRGSQVIPAQRSRDMMGSAGGVQVVNNFNVDARGAVNGVAAQVQEALAQFAPRLEAQTVATIRSAARRGAI